MIVPLICFIVGGIILYHALAAHGIPLLRKSSKGVMRRDRLIFFTSYTLIALAFILGLPGYLGYLNAAILHPARIAMSGIGSILLSYQIIDIASRH